jgi:adenosylcobinamide amidohydrolase
MHWEILLTSRSSIVRRHGRFLVADLQIPHRVLGTSARNGGQTETVRHLINHQSCEGAGHDARFHVITAHGQEAYHDVVCGEVGVAASASAVMGTAANMNYAALVTECDDALAVTAIVTAGVQTNAVCAGDPSSWRETPDGMVKIPPVAGTINTILLVNMPVVPSALARIVVTMTEGKTAALQRLAVPSCYSEDLATGTGTDQFCVAAPIEEGFALTSASPHMKLGELVGLAVRRATVEALRWQNGLEASYTRGLFHALARYGVREQSVMDDLAPLLEPADLELLRRNSKAAFYEPMVGAAAHALATVLDRARHQTLPASVVPDAVIQQAATLAAGLSAKPDLWPEFRVRLHAAGYTDAKRLVLHAVALGWSEKWRTR